MSEWLRRQTRNLLGFPAQVQILLLTFFLLGLGIFFGIFGIGGHLVVTCGRGIECFLGDWILDVYRIWDYLSWEI